MIFGYLGNIQQRCCWIDTCRPRCNIVNSCLIDEWCTSNRWTNRFESHWCFCHTIPAWCICTFRTGEEREREWERERERQQRDRQLRKKTNAASETSADKSKNKHDQETNKSNNNNNTHLPSPMTVKTCVCVCVCVCISHKSAPAKQTPEEALGARWTIYTVVQLKSIKT